MDRCAVFEVLTLLGHDIVAATSFQHYNGTYARN